MAWTKNDWIERIQRGDKLEDVSKDFIEKVAKESPEYCEMPLLDQIFWDSICFNHDEWRRKREDRSW